MPISQYTDDELKDELLKHEKKTPERPPLIGNPDLKKLTELCERYMDFRFGDDYHEDNNFQIYIYECVLRTFYGKNVFNMIQQY